MLATVPQPEHHSKRTEATHTLRATTNHWLMLVALLLALLLTGRSPCRAAEQITCVSDKGLWTHCDLMDAHQAEVGLVQQLSRSKCEKGVTWGVDGEGIWVDKGCRAIFEYTRGVQASAPPREKNDIFSPTAGVLCDRKVEFCYDSQGASVDLTQSVFGEKAAGQLTAILRNVGAGGGGNAFTLSNGVTCYPKERACKERRCEEIVNRNYSELLFGRDREGP